MIKGDQRGRTIGFPTANITLPEMTKPAFGVYTVAACLVDQPDAPIMGGVANIGVRPALIVVSCWKSMFLTMMGTYMASV